MNRALAMLVAVFVFFAQPVCAQVYTTQGTEGYGDCVYVAGSPDKYPIEYYDEKTQAYAGIIPELLCKISERTGIDFVYINGDKTDKFSLSENLQVEIVSSVHAEQLQAGKDRLELVRYSEDGIVQVYGLVFTALADTATIDAIKGAAAAIPAEERSGLYLAYAHRSGNTNMLWPILTLVLAVLLLAGLAALLYVRIRRLRKESLVEKMTDAETGMGNLQHFKYHFRYTIDDVSRSLYYLAYVVLDSSYLRSYHGDSSFEDVLRYTAGVLNECAADREFGARITENGFALAFQASNDTDAEQRMREVMVRLNSFEEVKDKSSKLVFHAAMYHLAASDKNCEILLFNLRRNCNKIFGTERQLICCDVHSMNRVQEEKKTTESILRGFERNEFKLYLQFIVDRKTKQIASAEALSRWDSASKGLLGPGEYIPAMEAAGLISRHDFYMFELACRQLERWKDTPLGHITVSCNFTRITISEENFIDRLRMIANGYDINREQLCIEITEDAMEKDAAAATENVRKCKEMGFRIYLDDMGSGYTSLANLCDYPIDVVKIDRDILLKTDSARGNSLFAGIIALAHKLGILVVCEGVETEAQNALVSDSECDYIQGWYYAKPLPTEECASFVERYNKNL